jgi:hypothetical protein
MRIRLTAPNSELSATMLDNATARDFVSLLPLTLTLRDYESAEKISDLPQSLSTDGAPPGANPEVGDVTLYAPWGNLAIFYRDAAYADGLVKLGTVDGDLGHLATLAGDVTFELIDGQR